VSKADASEWTIDRLRQVHSQLAKYVVRTPTDQWSSPVVSQALGPSARVYLKLEVWQRTGTFKSRAAINNLLAIPGDKRVTAVSAGNHAVAVAYAASVTGADAKIVMYSTANPARVEAAKSYGAEIVFEAPGPGAFAKAQELVAAENRVFVHPFDGPRVTEATAGVALEILEDLANLDAIVVAIGGGGLASGVATATKLLRPTCAVYGVEPVGANAMQQSLRAGRALGLDRVDTIADSLAPPMTTAQPFELCRQYVDDVVAVSDDELAAAMAILFSDRKLAVEPACAASTAALFGPLRERLKDRRVAIIACGSNIDRELFCSLLARGETAVRTGSVGNGNEGRRPTKKHS
jgi:threonine dehydratase